MTEFQVRPWLVIASRGSYLIGGGRVIGVRPDVVGGSITIWTEEEVESNASRRIQVVHTNDNVPATGKHLGTCLGNSQGYGQWHVYELSNDSDTPTNAAPSSVAESECCAAKLLKWLTR